MKKTEIGRREKEKTMFKRKDVLKKSLKAFVCVAILATVQNSMVLAADVAINENNFPDEVFRALVTENFDTDKNNKLSETEIAAVTEIKCGSKGIMSLQGVEYFTALEKLTCSGNSLSSLDVSQNKSLNYLECMDNSISSLSLNENANFTGLYCGNNQLKSLDVSRYTELWSLWCGGNHLNP